LLATSSTELSQNKKALEELRSRVKADAEKIAAGQSSTGQIEELKSNLQHSEEHLKEAEEIAWKAKAEASELIYALDQEQVSVKRMNEQIEKMRDETSKLATEHALALESFQTRLKQQQNDGVKEDSPMSNKVKHPPNGETKVVVTPHLTI
jgi:chromosome segregation ATPase